MAPFDAHNQKKTIPEMNALIKAKGRTDQDYGRVMNPTRMEDIFRAGK